MQNSVENFEQYLRTGVEEGLVSLNEDGGYILPPETEKIILDELYHRSVMRQISSYYNTTADDITHSGSSGSSASWETEDINIDDHKKDVQIDTHGLISYPKMLQKNIDHANFRILNWLADCLIDDFSRKENEAFLYGDGIGKPTGILNHKGVKKIRNYNVTCDAMIDLHYNLPEKFSINACILANRSTISMLQKLKDGNGKHPYIPALSANSKDTFMGKDVYLCEKMPGIINGSIPIVMGDFKSGYGIVDKVGITILRDRFTDKPFVKFYTTKKVGGDILDPQAFVKLQIGER